MRRFIFTRFSLGLALCAALIAAILLANPAYAQLPPSAVTGATVHVTVGNVNSHNVWVDISKAVSSTKWGIVDAFCLAPKHTATYDVHYATNTKAFLGDPELRVRAEVKHGDCSTGNIRVLQAERTYSWDKVHTALAIIGDSQLVIR